MALASVPYIQHKTGDSGTASHADKTLTYGAATGGQRHAIYRVDASYSGGTPAGALQIKDGVGLVFDLDIVAAGPQAPIVFDPPLAGTPNTAMTVTLLDGGSGIVGKLNVTHGEMD